MRQTRDLARVGWRGLAPFLPIGPHERPRLADSFSRLGQARGASPGSLDQRSGEYSGRSIRMRPFNDQPSVGLWGEDFFFLAIHSPFIHAITR